MLNLTTDSVFIQLKFKNHFTLNALKNIIPTELQSDGIHAGRSTSLTRNVMLTDYLPYDFFADKTHQLPALIVFFGKTHNTLNCADKNIQFIDMKTPVREIISAVITSCAQCNKNKDISCKPLFTRREMLLINHLKFMSSGVGTGLNLQDHSYPLKRIKDKMKLKTTMALYRWIISL
ncbi:hypothetical protein AAIQ60_004498 [Salmonella enterica]